MKYAVIAMTDGSYNVHAEGFENNLDGAKASYHDYCKALWNDKDTAVAEVALMDENLDVVEGKYKERISHGEN